MVFNVEGVFIFVYFMRFLFYRFVYEEVVFNFVDEVVDVFFFIIFYECLVF